MSEITIDLEVEKKRFFKWFAYLMVHFGAIFLAGMFGPTLLYDFVFYSWVIIFFVCSFLYSCPLRGTIIKKI